MHPLAKLTLTGTRLFFREPLSVFFALAFPPVLLAILGSVPSFREPSKEFGGARVVDLCAPIVIAMSIAMLAFSALPQILATYREKGILRRMATTPVRPVMVLAAQLLMCVGAALVTLILVLAVGRIAFDVPLPQLPVGYVLAYVLTTVTALTIGLLVAALAPSGKGAGSIGTILFFPALFFAGLWFPRASMPEALRRISDFTPLGAGVQSLQDTASGHWPQLLHVAVMLVWTVAAGTLAARKFRWE